MKIEKLKLEKNNLDSFYDENENIFSILNTVLKIDFNENNNFTTFLFNTIIFVIVIKIFSKRFFFAFAINTSKFIFYHKIQNENFSNFKIIMKLWCKNADVFKIQYANLLKTLRMLQFNDIVEFVTDLLDIYQ